MPSFLHLELIWRQSAKKDFEETVIDLFWGGILQCNISELFCEFFVVVVVFVAQSTYYRTQMYLLYYHQHTVRDNQRLKRLRDTRVS